MDWDLFCVFAWFDEPFFEQAFPLYSVFIQYFVSRIFRRWLLFVGGSCSSLALVRNKCDILYRII